jgi:uncharacterized phage-associated protein
MIPQFKVDERTAVEAILYIASKTKEPTFHRIFKLLYFADRIHLARYGRFICGDKYIAMAEGPVPSRMYNILKAERNGIIAWDAPEADGAFEVVHWYGIQPSREPDLDQFSDSDIECLDEAIREYDHYTKDELSVMSHDDAWKSAGLNRPISIEAIIKSIGEPNGLREFLQNPHP